ncbi:MAG: hypothetical protein N3F66_11845 [Spirochaetes bacterium]|nr:hypothetical protein [Spirochaetota bacterium]
MIAIINPDTPLPVIDGLVKNGFIPIQVPLCPLVERPIAGHPDIQLCIIGQYIVYQPAIDPAFLQSLISLLSHKEYAFIKGQSMLQTEYPYDCAYNCAYTGTVAFHNTKVTDSSIKEILATIHQCSDPIIHVNQGYTKCSTCIVDTDAIITSDISIHKAAKTHTIDSLLITPGYIDLPGYKYGFIGGASGIAADTVYFTGTLATHPDYNHIIDFIAQHNKKIVFLSDLPAIDIGSIFFIDTKK